MSSIQYATLSSDHAVPVEPVPEGGSVAVKVLAGDTVYYADVSSVSSSGNQGSLSSGQSHTFTLANWLRSATSSDVQLTYKPPALPSASLAASTVDATSATSGQVPVADGSNGYAWGNGVVVASAPNTFTANQTFQKTSTFTLSSATDCVIVNGNGATDTAATQSTVVEIDSNITNPDANARPVALHSRFYVTPGGAPSIATDFHGWDLEEVIPAGATVNANTRLYGLEMACSNKSNTTVADIVPVYGLVDVGNGGASGGISTSGRSFQASINLANAATVNQWFGYYVRPPFNSGGGGTITQAVGLYIPAWAQAGITLTTAQAINVQAGGGAIVTGENIVVNNTNASSPVGQFGVKITNDSTKTVAALATIQNGAAVGISHQQVGGAVAVNIDCTNAGTAGFYPIQTQGYDYGPNFTTSQNGGITLTLQKTGTGNGVGMRVINKGTGDAIQWQIGSTPTTALKFTALGSLVVGQGAQLATTATDGFVYLPSCAGTPTGVPTTQTGSKAAVYDTTNDKLWVYNGAWKGVVLA